MQRLAIIGLALIVMLTSSIAAVPAGGRGRLQSA